MTRTTAVLGGRRNALDLTTWEFGRRGWWLSHLALIAGAMYLGYRLGRREVE